MIPEWDACATEREFCEIMYGLVRAIKPSVCVEAGTYKGHAAHFISGALEANNKGHLYTADTVGYGHGFNERVTFIKRDFADMLETIPQVDFAFIDASDLSRDDGAAMRLEHWDLVHEKLTPGGIICTHDTLVPAPPWKDGHGGATMYEIRRLSQLNIDRLKGLSVYQK